MTTSAKHAPDTTGDTAVGDMSGDTMLVEVLSRIENERERVLILAHICLDISLRNLERALGVNQLELADEVNMILARLRDDADLAAKLSGIRRAGRIEHYQGLAMRLGLQDWFCSWCGDLMVQPDHGVKRKTCSGRCRTALCRAGGIGWKDQHRPRPIRATRRSPDLLPSAHLVSDHQEELLEMIRHIDRGEPGSWAWRRTFWWVPEIQARDRALLLLGFMCPVPLSPFDLAKLDVKDVLCTPKGLDILLRPQGNKVKRYVVMPPNDHEGPCPVRAMSAWQKHLIRGGFRTGPLFVRTDYTSGQLARGPNNRLGGRAIAQVIETIMRYAKFGSNPYGYVYVPPDRPIPSLLDRITSSGGRPATD